MKYRSLKAKNKAKFLSRAGHTNRHNSCFKLEVNPYPFAHAGRKAYSFVSKNIGFSDLTFCTSCQQATFYEYSIFEIQHYYTSREIRGGLVNIRATPPTTATMPMISKAKE